MYHVISDLETLFRDPSDVKNFLRHPIMKPYVPLTAMDGEDTTTPRICVAPTIEQCFDALSVLGRFRRCLNANPDAKSYENDDEAYPVLILRFADGLDYVKPDRTQVPDAEETGEHWLLDVARPESVELKWLGAYSVLMDEDMERVTEVRFLDDVSAMHHPWLDNKGHPLESGQNGDEPWPGDIAKQFNLVGGTIGFEARIGRRVVLATPLEKGFAVCVPIEIDAKTGRLSKSGEPYRAMLHDIRIFSGFRDRDGDMLFDRDTVRFSLSFGGCPGMMGVVHRRHDGWYVLPYGRTWVVDMANMAVCRKSDYLPMRVITKEKPDRRED